MKGRRRQTPGATDEPPLPDRKSTRLNSSHANISYAVFCLKKKLQQVGLGREREISSLTLDEGQELAASQSSRDRKSTCLNSSHANISYAVFYLKNKQINK